jgi:hypothetical protein
MHHTEIGFYGLNYINVTEDMNNWPAVVNTVMNLQVAYSRGNFFTSSLITRFCRGAVLHVIS